MIHIPEYVDALSFLITFSIAFVLFFWLWQEYVIDSTRQQLFELRDELFDLATLGELDRNAECYRMLRELFNNSIRFAHRLDFWHLIIMILSAKLLGEHNFGRFAKHIDEMIRSIEDPKIKAHVLAIVEKQNRVLVWHVFRRSLFLLLLLPLVLLVALMVLVSTDMITKAMKKAALVISASICYSES